MMQDFVVYDDRGEIHEANAVLESMIHLQGSPGRNIALGKGHWDTHYVNAGVIVVRPAMSAVLTENAITGLPVPCTVYVNEKAYPCTDTEAELAFAYPGKYAIRVEAFPFQNATFTVYIP